MSEIQPVRIQRSRAKGARLVSPNGLPIKYVGRPTKWGNPFEVGRKYWDSVKCVEFVVRDRAHAVELFESYLRPIWKDFNKADKDALQGCNLSCWCSPSEPCHADVLLKLVNENGNL